MPTRFRATAIFLALSAVIGVTLFAYRTAVREPESDTLVREGGPLPENTSHPQIPSAPRSPTNPISIPSHDLRSLLPASSLQQIDRARLPVLTPNLPSALPKIDLVVSDAGDAFSSTVHNDFYAVSVMGQTLPPDLDRSTYTERIRGFPARFVEAYLRKEVVWLEAGAVYSASLFCDSADRRCDEALLVQLVENLVSVGGPSQ